MPVEVMHPPGVMPLISEGDKSPDSSAATFSTIPTPEQEIIPTSPEFQLPLQREVSERLLKLFGPDYTPAMGHRSLRERGRRLTDTIQSVDQLAMNRGELDIDTLSEIGDRNACVRISASILASKLGIDLAPIIEKKLVEKVQRKYDPDLITDIRLYGTFDNPGRKTGPEAMIIAKQSFDTETGQQTLRPSGRSVPSWDENRRVPDRMFGNYLQDLAHWWQTRALGSDLVPSDRVTNLISEDGEIEEALAALGGLSADEINNLNYSNEEDRPLLDDLGEELADVFIGTWCTDAVNGIDSDVKDKERMEIAVKKYDSRLKYLDELHRRELLGLQPPTPPIVWHSSKRGIGRGNKVIHQAGDVDRAHTS
jgi:NTP pyrophosphatase (non-canonical NTP hydrolase)